MRCRLLPKAEMDLAEPEKLQVLMEVAIENEGYVDVGIQTRREDADWAGAGRGESHWGEHLGEEVHEGDERAGWAEVGSARTTGMYRRGAKVGECTSIWFGCNGRFRFAVRGLLHCMTRRRRGGTA